MSEDLSRVSMTVPQALLEEVDDVVEGWDYDSRSEAMRDALRELVTEYRTETAMEGTQRGSVVVQYDHHAGDVTETMTALQHEFAETIVAVQHVHLSHDICMETLAVDGTGAEIRALSNRLRALSGVKQVQVAVVDASADES
jgi:CopG family nickel-responsive transcriptional regulator